MVDIRQKWFSRQETVAELQGCEFLRRRKAFFSDKNEDFRLKQPGVRWCIVKEKREEVYQDCICRIKEVFDDVCEKITGDRRKSTSSPMPVLPTIKTPAISVHRGYRRSTRQSSRVLSQIQPYQESFTSTDQVSPKVVAHAIPLRFTRHSTRFQSKVYESKSPLKADTSAVVPGSVSTQNITPQSSSHTQVRPVPDINSEQLHSVSEDVSSEAVVSQILHPTTVIPDIHPSGIQKLQEEHRSRNKGRLVSLFELRNASPAFKESSKKIRTRCKPRATASVTPRIGNKRLRSVSLERLSTDHLQAATGKKTMKLLLDENSAPGVDPKGESMDSKVASSVECNHEAVSLLRPDELKATKPFGSDEMTEEDQVSGCDNDTEPQQEEPKPMELAGTGEDDSVIVVSGDSSNDKVSPVKLRDEIEESPDTRSSPTSGEQFNQQIKSLTNSSSCEGTSDDVGDSSQDEVSPMELRDESEDSPGTSGSSSQDDEMTPDSHGEEFSEDALNSLSPVHSLDADKTKSSSKSSKSRVLHFFGKKGVTGDTKNTNKPPAIAPLSFLARNSPQKLETFQSRQEKLATKVLLKKEEEERRKDELKMKRQQELQEKIRKREERRKRVAEKQAELRKQQDEKKRKLEDISSRDDQIKKINQLKAKEKEEKNKKLKQRMHAAELRRKQEEEQQKKKLQQMEDDRRMVIELANKRKELEEEEKRQKRLEKMKLDRERQLQREAELLDKEEQKRKQLEEEEKRSVDAYKKRLRAQPILGKKQIIDPKTKLEKLLESAAPKPTATSGAVNGVTPNKQDSTQKFLRQWSKMIKGNSRPGYCNSPKPFAVNTTFTLAGTPDRNTASAVPIKTPDNYHILPGSALSCKVKEKLQGITSYEMTPAENDPLYTYENYDIGNLSSEDSTDDEDSPKKEIPQWAHPESLKRLMEIQEISMAKHAGDVAHIFPPEELLRDPDLARIFRQKRKRFYHRSSSAQWDSPMYKRY